MDNEIKGEGNSINYKYRMHDPRVGRFFAVDPLTADYPHYTPYSFSGNKVIHAIELEGLEELIFMDDFEPYLKGVNQIILANDELIERYNSIQREEKSHIKIFFSARNMINDRKFNSAHAKTKRKTGRVHNFIKFQKGFERNGWTPDNLSESQRNVYNKSLKAVESLGLDPSSDLLSLDNEYFLVELNTRFTGPAEVGVDFRGYEWEGLLENNVSTLLHEVYGHVLKQLETMYAEHDYLYGFSEFSDHYTAEELIQFRAGHSPSPDRVAPDSLMGQILSEIKKAIQKLNEENENKDNEEDQRN